MRVLIATTCTPDDRKTLCAVRALGAAGAEVVIASDRLIGGACRSKFIRKRIQYQSEDARRGTSISAIAESLAAELAQTHYDALLPMNDYAMLAASTERESLARHTTVVAPELDSLLVTRDKLETVRLAESLGIDAPATRHAASAGEVAEIAGGIVYPCVMKPRKGAGGVGLAVADSRQALLDAYGARSTTPSDDVYDFDRVLIQEFVPGVTHDVCVLMNHGKPRAVMTQRRLLTYPRHGGVGIHCETTHEPELAERAIALLESLGWHGPAQVEFKVDERGGRIALIEINGRFWGSLDLAVFAGVNFPLLACNMVGDRTGDAAPLASYPVGRRYRWPVAYGLLATMESPEPRQTLRSMFAREEDSRSDLCLSDPLPHFAELAYVARRLYARRSVLPQRTAAWPG